MDYQKMSTANLIDLYAWIGYQMGDTPVDAAFQDDLRATGRVVRRFLGEYDGPIETEPYVADEGDDEGDY